MSDVGGGGNRPYCEDCIVRLTVEHALIECLNFHNVRGQHFQRRATLEEVLGERGFVEFGGPLYKYLREINIFNKI